MKTDIILAGVGGQGILSIATALGGAVLLENLYLKQAETHGMSQRGGAVVSHLRISEKPVASDLIPLGGADLILSVEPMESLRYLPFLKEDGYLVTNTNPFVNIPDYPEINLLMERIRNLPHYVAIDADQIAREIGNSKTSNMVMLGAASPFIHIEFSKIEAGIRSTYERTGEAIESMNMKALHAGRHFAEANR
ncbi:MAG: indolepyruvate oxidoreductase subunit beta [Prolixibacteraceae bacterium]